ECRRVFFRSISSSSASSLAALPHSGSTAVPSPGPRTSTGLVASGWVNWIPAIVGSVMNSTFCNANLLLPQYWQHLPCNWKALTFFQYRPRSPRHREREWLMLWLDLHYWQARHYTLPAPSAYPHRIRQRHTFQPPGPAIG